MRHTIIHDGPVLIVSGRPHILQDTVKKSIRLRCARRIILGTAVKELGSYLGVVQLESLPVTSIVTATKLHASRSQKDRTPLQQEQRNPGERAL
jgi:hypothetical protein